MECEVNVYNAAKDDNLYELRKLLDNKPEDKVSSLVSALTHGATPLIIACRNGHLDVAIYLLDKCHADVDQVGSVEFNNILYDGTPLWCAAVAGHLNIVKILIEFKASVNSTTGGTRNSTPLISACLQGNFEVAKYLIQHGADFQLTDTEGYSCLMYSCSEENYGFSKYLIDRGANVNKITNCGNTALSVCVRSGNLDLAQFLIQHGADIKLLDLSFSLMSTCSQGNYKFSKYLVECGADVNSKTEKGYTVLHACIISGNLKIFKMLVERGAKMIPDEYGQTPLLSAACKGQASIVEYIFRQYFYRKRDKVNVLELLGAAFVDKPGGVDAARSTWRRAMKLRNEDKSCPLEKTHDKSPISSYVNTTEVRTLDELNALNEDQMYMQALLVKERILGADNSDSIYSVRVRGQIYAKNGQFEKSIRLYKYVLDVERNRQTREKIWNAVYNVCLGQFTEILYKMVSQVCEVANGLPVASVSDILHIFENSVTVIGQPFNEPRSKEQVITTSYVHLYHAILIMSMDILRLVCKLRPYLNSNEEMSLKKAAYKLVHINPNGRYGFTPLHLASLKTTSIWCLTVPPFACPEVVEVLLDVGADPNSVDLKNNTPLHIAAMDMPCTIDVFRLLLNREAHLDVCNNENQTPLQLVKDASQLDIYPLQHLNLQCLCARAINTHTISYEGLVTGKLNDFIGLHSSH